MMPIFLILFLLQCITLRIVVEATDITKEKEAPFLVIEPISYRVHGLFVVKKVQDTLNLTCTVFDNSNITEPIYNITWITPRSSTNSKNRVVIQSSANSVNLVVPHLEARDGGEYECRAQHLNSGNLPLSSKVTVNIKNRKKACGETMFFCSLSKLQNCIHRRYKCDGHEDCEMGEDEDLEVCGESPCSKKLECEDPHTSVVRCIPESWCCDARVDINCTTREPLSCCPISFHKIYMERQNYYASQQPQYMSVLQTTIYIVVGSAVMFMFVVTLIIIALCRVHMSRSLRGPITQAQAMAMYEYDGGSCPLEAPGFLVTYNINNGVQIIGHAVDPPPYCEVICIPPREGPPPPYSSCEVLDQPETEVLLQNPQDTTTEDQSERRQLEDQSVHNSSS